MTKRTSSKPQPTTAYTRPGGLINLTLLTVVAAVVPLGTALALLAGIAKPPGGVPDAVYTVAWLAVGVAAAVCAWAFWMLKPWAWRATFVVMIVSILVSVLVLFRGTETLLGAINIAPPILVLYMINTPGARRYFRGG